MRKQFEFRSSHPLGGVAMTEGVRRVVGEAVKRLGAVATGTGGGLRRFYRRARSGVDVDVSVKTSAEAAGRDLVTDTEVRTAGGRPVVATSRLMSVDEFTARLRAAERSGEPEIRSPAEMDSAKNGVELLVYPDGFEVVRKVDLGPARQSAEILAAAVGRAIGAPVAPVIAGEGGVLLMQRLPGRVVPGTRVDPGARAAMEAVKDLPGARKLGELDVLVRNWDRPNNWLRDGDHVYGYDHEEAFRADRDFDSESNPFTSHYATPSPRGAQEWNEWKPNDLSRTELSRDAAEIAALRPLFEEHARMDWAKEGEPLTWYDDIVSRVGRLREHATRP
ncbi:hypothetical protein [Nocardia testacea]|uniref:hypothetical protein n=1 Tax=Nocardia testacea TaxID=248551 RepID=UPI0002E860EC|nr:hypothetical protein [Nocardia testacea]